MPLRGGPNDFFAKHAAEGKRRPSHQQRVYLHQLPVPQGQQQPGDSGGGDASEGGGCPAAWFLGLDPTPEPGLRSPTNFAGGWAQLDGSLSLELGLLFATVQWRALLCLPCWPLCRLPTSSAAFCVQAWRDRLSWLKCALRCSRLSSPPAAVRRSSLPTATTRSGKAQCG